MRDINKIIIHCAATPNGKAFTVKDIDRWHKERGWKKVGYHYVIRIDGVIEVGRQISEVGAHVKGHNQDSLGICMIGTDKFTCKQWSALYRLLDDLKISFPNATIHGHNEFSNKLCPGFDVKPLLKHIL